jgi:integrase/recombinase XerD
MASIKVLLWNKKNKEDLYPIAIRIIKDRKPSYIYLGHYIRQADWDEANRKVKKSHPNSTRLNTLILKKLAEANDTLLDLQTFKKDTTSGTIKRSIKTTGNTSFFKYAKEYLDTLKECGKYNRYTADKPRIERFREFLKEIKSGSDISFAEITTSLLQRFGAYLKNTHEISERTIVNYFIVFRTIFNQAIANNIVDRKYYPFGRGKIVIKFPDTIKLGLTEAEVLQLEAVELPVDSTEHHARNLWLFSFYLAGMRISDVMRLTWTDIQDGRLHYSMGKNAKAGSLKMPDKAIAIIEQYQENKQSKTDYIFPDLKRLGGETDKFIIQRTIAFATSRLDKILRKNVAPKAAIEKKLTMHIARHTFGNLSGDKIPIQMLQKLYRHSSVTTTIGYQANFIHKDADSALDSVINF